MEERPMDDVQKYNEIYTPEKWGEVVSLTAGYKLLDADGKIVDERSWKSQSYVRWFGILIEQLFSGINRGGLDQLTDFVNNVYAPQWAFQGGFHGDGKFVPRFNETPTNSPAGFKSGAMMGIGTGALTGAQSDFKNLKTPFGDNPYDAMDSVFKTQDDAVALEFAVQQGITNATNAMITITEQALFARVRAAGGDTNSTPFVQMFAYDEINPGVSVNVGQTFVPRYTLRFQA
jgi:hypothetical protein